MNAIIEFFVISMLIVLVAAGFLLTGWLATNAWDAMHNRNMFNDTWFIVATIIFATAVFLISCLGALLGLSAIFGIL
jgi:uncharacterized membrane protein YfhO